MNKIKQILLVLSISSIFLGLLLFILNGVGRNTFFTLGLLGVLIYYLAKSIKDIILKRNNILGIILQILIALMSIILFSKYLHHLFGDYPGLIIIPCFVLIAFLYFFCIKQKDKTLIFTTILYLLLIIPLFINENHLSPRKYIFKNHNISDPDSIYEITLPYTFQSTETERLHSKSRDFTKAKQYHKAITLLNDVRKIEPLNPKLLFDLSENHTLINELETAILFLDTAIMLDSNYAPFYNNRGLLYYKLYMDDKAESDYIKAIELDSTNPIFYGNFSLLYYSKNEFEKACEYIKKAERLGFDVTIYEKTKQIKEKCDAND